MNDKDSYAVIPHLMRDSGLFVIKPPLSGFLVTYFAKASQVIKPGMTVL